MWLDKLRTYVSMKGPYSRLSYRVWLSIRWIPPRPLTGDSSAAGVAAGSKPPAAAAAVDAAVADALGSWAAGRAR